MGAPSTHNMSSLSLAKHVHGRVEHVHWSNHSGTMMSWGLELWLLALMSV
jgi:hypothetical protein